MNWKPPARYAALVAFVHTYLWVQLMGGGVAPFRLNGVQRRFLDLKDRHLAAGGAARFLVLKARRTGISTVIQAENYHCVQDAAYMHATTLAHTREDTDAIFRISKLFHRKASPLLGGEQRANKRELIFHDGQSSFYTGTAGSRGFGRGATIHKAHLSESAHYPFSVEDQENFLAGITDAARDGEVIQETTANGTQGLFWRLWEESKEGGNDWCRVFIPWWWDASNTRKIAAEEAAEIADTLTDDELALIDRVHAEEGVHLTPNQIAWRRRMKREKGRLFPQEYPEDDVTAFLRSGVCYFDPEVIQHLLGAAREPGSRVRRGSGDWLEWRAPEEGRRYVIGADTSEGVPGGDYSAAYVEDLETGEDVAALHGLWRPYEFAALLAQLADRYNGATIGPEVNNHGHAVLEALTHVHHYPQHRIYRRRQIDTITRKRTERLGWKTDAVTRDKMLADFAQRLHEGSSAVNCRELLRECLSFVRGPMGKYEAAGGAHDDRVMARAICQQVRSDMPATPGMVVL